MATFNYGPYGQPAGTTGVTSPIGWAGEYRDAESGMVYLRVRNYDPATGQFMSRDPIEVQTRSAYGYVGGFLRDNVLYNWAYSNPDQGMGVAVGAATAAVILGGVVVVVEAPVAIAAASTQFQRVSSWLQRCAPQTARTIDAQPDLANLSPKVQREMAPRGWTPDRIAEAVRSGQAHSAVNKLTNAPATRYVHPATGQSVVIDNATGAVVHVGGPGFRY